MCLGRRRLNHKLFEVLEAQTTLEATKENPDWLEKSRVYLFIYFVRGFLVGKIIILFLTFAY